MKKTTKDDVRGNPWSRLCDKAARSAVLYPLFGKPIDAAGVLFRLRQLVASWHSRVFALGAAGWLDAKAASSLYACSPAGISTLSYFRCGRVRVCPFCYARDVAGWFNRISLACAPDRPLWELSATWYTDTTAEAIHPAWLVAEDFLKQLRKSNASPGGLSRITLDPVRLQDGDHFRLVCRILWELPQDTLQVEQGRLYRSVLPRDLVRLVARTWRYPRGLMRHPELNYVLTVLAGLEGKRQTRAHGGWQKKPACINDNVIRKEIE